MKYFILANYILQNTGKFIIYKNENGVKKCIGVHVGYAPPHHIYETVKSQAKTSKMHIEKLYHIAIICSDYEKSKKFRN